MLTIPVCVEQETLDDQLINAATEALQRSYAPYSNFRVGAALLTEDNTIVKGCNIENISFTPTVCAERTAVFKAVSDGHMNFKAIAIVSEDQNPTPPCGVCRQVMGEFVHDDFDIILANTKGRIMKYQYKDLFPLRFVPQTTIGNFNVWQELRDVIQQDNIITDEEFLLVQQILEDINLLEEHVDLLSIENTITDEDRKIIAQLRKKVYDTAHATANLDDQITEEEQLILKKLAELLDIERDVSE